MALYGGLDLGSTTGKLMLIDENRKILGWSIVPSQGGPEKTAAAARAKAFEAAGLSEDTKIDYLIATGYGRNNFKSKDEDISEISCHALGAHTLQPQARTIVDIGGQDCKVILLNDRGRVLDFQMNDRCSAGTGRFFEVIARVLGITLTELSENALKSDNPCRISKQCSVFAESEVITLVNNNVSIEDICSGVCDSIARRIKGMILKVGLEEDVVLTGGCAQNKGLAVALEKTLGVKLAPLSEHPQVMGALGAAIFALEHATGVTTSEAASVPKKEQAPGSQRECGPACDTTKPTNPGDIAQQFMVGAGGWSKVFWSTATKK